MTNSNSKSSAQYVSVSEAASLINQGALVAFPTETVYGLGADATEARAVKLIFTAKGRPASNPLIVHTNSVERLGEVIQLPATNDQSAIRARVDALLPLWPGPLTIVLPRVLTIAAEVTNGGALVGVRIPAHPIALKLLEHCHHPVAAPSANRSNRVSPTSARHVIDEFNGAIPVVDGGDCALGLESTVIEPRADGVIIHRPGFVTSEQIAALSGPILHLNNTHTAAPVSPGQMTIHYAPTTPCYRLAELPTGISAVHLIGLESDIGPLRDGLPPSWKSQTFPSINEYASQLYRALREVDEAGWAHAIAIVPPVARGLGLAICDRIHRATHR